ncbi:DUF4838 domain-containing protein [Niabella beijingensis]|uniref:DUF4838 domain-containing protein n=1 Tax=Niabella beijingensis TaxID=2872700 RepID=UPI001CC062ED|nr:DUF4838 domain-containing protein [Niabella beijingensis]MBZ4188326.1 DUF4838 domain-containing protein [Niabella beijingensis]
MKNIVYLIIVFFMQQVQAQNERGLVLVRDGSSSYSIVISRGASPAEEKAAGILQDYLVRTTTCKLPIERSSAIAGKAIRLSEDRAALQPEQFTIEVKGPLLEIKGGARRGLLFGVYDFIENFLGCRKWNAGEPAYCPQYKELLLPGQLHKTGRPAFEYREVYYPGETDPEYLDWHKLQQLEDLWGIWGHSFNKLVDPAIYFKSHPEYYSYFNGKRQPLQLCLTNDTVFQIAAESLKKAFAAHPDALYWSVSPNDDIGYCECDACRKADAVDGGPQGSLIRFVNRIAATFPDKKFTTLAYTYAARPPLKTVPGKNVYILLSNIDAYRLQPVGEAPSAAAFRKNLAGWIAKTPNVFVWDYYTQFTNYLAPFPDIPALMPGVRFFQQQQVKGVFAQGSGATYSDMAELKSYLLAKALWDPGLDATVVADAFIKGYYGNAAPYIKKYLDALRAAAEKEKVPLDIYGNIVNDHNSYLTPALMDVYSSLLDKAEAAAEPDPVLLKRVERVQLSLEYTYLQQSRFYGIGQHGIFYRTPEGDWQVHKGFEERVNRFVKRCNAYNVKELSEGGMSPAAYQKEWQSIFENGVRDNKALGAAVTLKYPYVPEYPAKKERTLTDGVPGYLDFSYNWLCFAGVPLEAVTDLGTVTDIREVELNFLEDQRHWIFLPASVVVQVSDDNVHYREYGRQQLSLPEEDFEIRRHAVRFTGAVSARYLKITALNREQLPEWRFSRTRKPIIATDEIWVR